MDLHTSGHHRGVAAAPHHAAAEAGRAVLANGGNAIEAMVAMAATIAVVYPHMNHVGGDGFLLVCRAPAPGARLHGGGPYRRACSPRSLPRARDDSAAGAARCSHCSRRDRWVDTGA